MDKTIINIDDLKGRGVDYLLYSAIYNEYPDLRTINNRKVYVIQAVRNKYISPPKRDENIKSNEATLPYYSTNIRDIMQLCQVHGYDYELAYVSKTDQTLASINNYNFIYRTPAGALSRVLLIAALKKRYKHDITLIYKLLGDIVEL